MYIFEKINPNHMKFFPSFKIAHIFIVFTLISATHAIAQCNLSVTNGGGGGVIF